MWFGPGKSEAHAEQLIQIYFFIRKMNVEWRAFDAIELPKQSVLVVQ
jgi:hypothetical protein